MFSNYLNRIVLRITETLGIEILKVRTLTTAEKIKINGRAAAGEVGMKAVSQSNLEKEAFDDEDEDQTEPAKAGPSAKPTGSHTQSKLEWLGDFSHRFTDIVVGGIEASLRLKVSTCIQEKMPLKGKLNQAVINSVNHHIFEFIGCHRPGIDLCRWNIFLLPMKVA